MMAKKTRGRLLLTSNTRKYSILFLIALSFNQCSDMKSNYFIPNEFQYPDNKVGGGKTFIYQNVSTKKMNYKSIENLKIAGKNYLISKDLDSSFTTDSAISLNGKTLENYTSVFTGRGHMLKENIIEDTIIANGLKLGKHTSRNICQTPETIIDGNVEENFIKDTVVTWQGKSLPCLVIRSIAKIQFNSLTDTSFKYILNASNIMYYAKGIGLMKCIIQFKDHNGKENYGDWELIEIKNLRN